MRAARLDDRGIYFVTVAVPNDRPEVVEYHTIPPAMLLFEHDSRRPQAALLRVQRLIRGGGIEKHRVDPPDPSVAHRRLRREEKALRLDIHVVAHGVRGTDAEVPVILYGQADEVGNGVLELLRQLDSVGLLV